MREDGPLSRGVSGKKGKLGLVELLGANSTYKIKAPGGGDGNIFKINRIKHCNNFCYYGSVENQDCSFRIDTGSDVSILNKKFVNRNKVKLGVKGYNLKYPTGETVPIESRVLVKVQLGKHSVEIPMFIAEISDDSILGVDFLKAIHLENIFDLEFDSFNAQNEGKTLKCFRVEDSYKCSGTNNSLKKVPNILKQSLECNSSHLSKTQKDDFTDFLTEFHDVFSENVVAGNCDIVRHAINLKDPSPIKQVPRRIPFQMRDEVNKIIEEMKEQGVIEESKSPWVSPAVLVRKKDGTIRFCVDFRKLNDVTKKDSYPLPRIDDILDQLSGNSWFSTLDLKSGYWQIKIRSEDREKTAFSIGSGLWQFTVMPFGLCNAPATFERLMEKVLRRLLPRICLVYLDDVIVFGKSFEEMVSNLREVFLCLRSANLKVNPKKCTFFERSVKYLGHVISLEGITTDPEKIIAVKDWPIPHNKRHLRSFLGLCSYYRKFIRGFSTLAKPLYGLTENQIKFSWDEKYQEAFEKLKGALTSSPILSFPKGEGEFILDTDASGVGVGAVLSQKQEGEEKVIAFYSRVLNKAERNYCTTRRELLAIVDSVKSFHHYLLGRKFLIRTDHISLKWLMSFKNLEGQLARWVERLQQYEFEISYRKGQVHKNADGLSRRQCEEIGCKYCEKVEVKNKLKEENQVARVIFEGKSLEEWQKEQREDPDILIFLEGKEEGVRPSREEIAARGDSARVYWFYWDALVLEKGVLYKKWESPSLKSNVLQLVVPQKCIVRILEEAHDSATGGHFGVNKTLDRIRKRFYWASCKQDVEDWCRSCGICVSKRGPSEKGKSALQVYNVGTPFERVQMDILGPLPRTNSGNKYLLVVVDCFTKWVEAFPLKNIRTKTVAEVFVEQVISRHGVPLEVHTDQGRNFESKLFKELMELLGIKKTRTTALHPQSDGQVERQHQTITNYLAKFISENQKDWDRWIPMFLLSYRSSKHETTGVTPAEVYFARNLRLPIDLLRGNPPGEWEENTEKGYINELKRRLDRIHRHVRERMEVRSSRTKVWYDRKARLIQFQEGQKVWLYNPRRERGKAPKLQSHWEGPYTVLKKLSDVVFCIRKAHRRKIVHADRLAIYHERKRI